MKVFIALLIVSSLVGSIYTADATATQFAASWIDDGTNTAQDVTKCCNPATTTTTTPITFSQGSATSKVTVAGTWGTSNAACTTLGVNGKTLASTDNTISGQAFPFPFTYTYQGTVSATLAFSSATAGTLTYKTGSTTCTISTLKADSWATGKPTTWNNAYASAAVTAASNCCVPKLGTAANAGVGNVITVTGSDTAPIFSWAWDTTQNAAACTAAGYSGTFTSAAGTFASDSSTFSIPQTAAATANTVTLSSSSATAATLAYTTSLGSCTYNLKATTTPGSSKSGSILPVSILSMLFVVLINIAL